MSLADTATSPENYGGILDPAVRGDEHGNVQSLGPTPEERLAALEDHVVRKETESVSVDPKWERERNRREALDFYSRIVQHIPLEAVPTTIDGILSDIDKVATWITEAAIE